VPAEVRPGLLDAVGAALNQRNRPRKRAKLASSSSEDAITWTVFQYLARHAGSDGPWRLLVGPGRGRGALASPTLLLWGVPIAGSAGASVRNAIIAISDRLAERAASRTEPDVVADFGADGVVVAEVKYGSANDRQKSSKPWAQYLDDRAAFRDPAAAQRSERYELVRNWRFGCELAGARPLTLVNLVATPEPGPHRARTEMLASALAIGPRRRFLQLTFDELLTAVPRPWSTWFAEYVTRHRLEGERAASRGR
jgi:hypothetical protein